MSDLNNSHYTPQQLLPHRAPMLLLDAMLDRGADSAGARVDIRANSPFCDVALGGVPAWVGVEYMAQTIGAWAGALRLQHGKEVTVGFLLGARRYESDCELFPLGSELTVRIDVLFSQPEGLGSFACRIDGRAPDGRALSASARINAFLPEQPQLFVKDSEALLVAARDADAAAAEATRQNHDPRHEEPQ